MEPIITPQTDNPPVPTPPSKRRHHLILVILAVIAGVGYITFNIWVYRYATSGNTPKTYKGVTLPKQGDTFSEPKTPAPIPTTPTPTPRPTGPGPFACSPDGTCNQYGEDIRKQYCPATFADSQCLDSCGDAKKRCSK